MSNRPRKVAKTDPNVQQDIRKVMANVSHNTKQHTLLPPRQTKAVNISELRTVSNVANLPIESCASKTVTTPLKTEASKSLLKNAYARELFYRYTNIKEVIAKKFANRSEKTQRHYCKHYYMYYVLEPKYRIRKDMENVRFVTRYHEGIFQIALKMPIVSAKDHEEYNRKLATSGIKKMCFVDMRLNNTVLQYQGELVSILKTKFHNWSGKLEKLSTYLIGFQRKRESEDRKFRSLLMYHSSLKGSWILNLPNVVEQLVQEARLPSHKRKNLHWELLTFDDDALNKKFRTGIYSKFEAGMVVEPEQFIETSSLSCTCSPVSSTQEPLELAGSCVTHAPPISSVKIKESPNWTANFSDLETSLDIINEQVRQILTRKEDSQFLSTDHNANVDQSEAERTTSNAEVLNQLTKAEHCLVSPPRIGAYITIEARRNPNRETLFATTSSRFCHSNSYMVFLSYVDIQSIRYTNIPTTWSQCNVFQQNQLTINLNPGCAGLFSVPIRDQYACQLLGLSAGGKGREALLAALAHVGKFRYGRKEPSYEYYRLTVTEKVLHLFFATLSPCPQGGGYVMFPKSKSSLPADGDEVWLESFNYYAHTKQPPVQSVGESVDEKNTNRADKLAFLLLPNIARQMKLLRERLMKAND